MSDAGSLRAIGVRALNSVLSLIAVTVLFFVLVEWAPGDFASRSAGQFTTAQELEAAREEYGLQRSPVERYLRWVGNAVRGDFGTSWWARQPIAAFLAEPLLQSLWLAGVAGVIAIPIGFGLGVMSVVWRGSWFDRMASSTAFATTSFPDFLVAYGLMALLGVHLKLFPVHTFFTDELSVIERLHATALPVLSLAGVIVTPLYRATRAALGGVLSATYIEMARLKGIGPWRVLLVHALPNAIAPIVNALAQTLGHLLMGLVVVEIIFSYPGFGKILIYAVQLRDIPLVLASSLICAAVYVSLVLAADIVAIVMNPRLREHPSGLR